MRFFDPYIPFSKRGALWADVTPLAQFDTGVAPICPIAYSPECTHIYNNFL